jgi:hypothetical protein
MMSLGMDNAVYQEYQEGSKSKSSINTKAAISAATTFLSGSVASLAQKEEDRDVWFKEQIARVNEVLLSSLSPLPHLSE